jgi:uncharacterized protein
VLSRITASWEGFALEQVLALTGAEQSFFWGTHAGAELDLLLVRRGRRYGIEFKMSDAPSMTRSPYFALEDPSLEWAWIVYPGDQTYPVHDRVEALPFRSVRDGLAALCRDRPDGG